MTEKYIDLHGDVCGDVEIGKQIEEQRVSVHDVLAWLDAHRDQVPGRTITESEFDRKVEEARGTGALRRILEACGITVVPDLEPTNAEKLKAVLDAIGDSTAGYREHLASKLDEAGVKAPGGDDDH